MKTYKPKSSEEIAKKMIPTFAQSLGRTLMSKNRKSHELRFLRSLAQMLKNV